MAKLTAEQARERFGLNYNESHASGGSLKDGALFVNGNYIGSMSGTKMEEQRSGPDKEAEGIGKYQAIEDYAIENGFGEARAEWNSYNDVQGAIEQVIGDDEKAPEVETPEPDPIYESDQVKQARERVQNYERSIMDGTTSRKIYNGNQNFMDGMLDLSNHSKGYLENYQFKPGGLTDDKPVEATYEADTYSGSDISPYKTESTPEKATASFMQAKKNQAIQDYNIKPVA